MENQITKGVIWKQILLFFFPIMLGTLFQQLYNTADAIVVGRFMGKEARVFDSYHCIKLHAKSLEAA